MIVRFPLFFLLCLCIFLPFLSFSEDSENKMGAIPSIFLTFDETYQDILANALEIKAAEADLFAKEAKRRQATAYPNPELSLNLSRIGRKVDGEENQLFVGMTQLVELGGKRSARARVAEAETCAAQWRLESMKCNLFAEVLHAFINVAVAQERLALAKSQHKLSLEALQCAQVKADAGKTSSLDIKKAEIACRSAKLEIQREIGLFSQAKKQLITLWDCQAPEFEGVCFPLYDLEAPPPLDLLAENLTLNPELIATQAEFQRSSEIVSLEKSMRVPDMAVQVGVLTERFTKKPTFSLGLNIPLPFFDRNQNNVCRATYERDQASFNEMNMNCRLILTLNALYEDWYMAYEQAMEIKNSLLPPSEEAYRLAQQSYLGGKFDYLYFLDAKATLYDIQKQYLEAVEQYHHKHADLLKLTARYNDFKCEPVSENVNPPRLGFEISCIGENV